jgi:hypothetical protein
MQYVLGNMLNGGGGLNADGLSLDLQFALDKTLTARKGPTPVFTRGSTGTFVGSNGLIQSATTNTPRFDHDPVTLASRGLLIEESRTNLVFPSATLTTQTRTVTATAHTLSFYGTGTVVLSGAHVATVTGTGAYPTRTTLTFTPTAGSLTLTVTGSVTEAQLEAGSFATSYIPTTTGTLARSADVCSIANTASFWNSDQFTLFGNANFPNPAHDAYAANFSITNGFFGVRRPNTNTATAIIRSLGVNADISLGTFVTGTMRMAVAHSSGQQAAAFNGGSATQASSAFSPSLNPALNIGYSGSAGYINGHIAAIRYYKKRLPNAKLAQLTA